MSIKTSLRLLGIVLTMGLFSACDLLENVYDDPVVEKQEGQYYVDATDYAQWVYVNLHTPVPTITTSTISLDDLTETGAPQEWDIAHHRYDVKTNGASVMMTPITRLKRWSRPDCPAKASGLPTRRVSNASPWICRT